MTSTAVRLPFFIPSQGMLLAGTFAVGLGAAVFLDPRIAGLIVAAVVAPVLIWADPRVAFALLAFGLGINLDVITSPVSVSVPQLISLALVAGVFVRERKTQRVGAWATGGLLFVAAALPSLIHAVSLPGAVAGIVKFFAMAVTLYAATQWLVRERATAEGLLPLLVIGAAISLIPGIVQVVLDIGPAAYRTGGVMRAYSTYGQPNSWALYLVGVLPVAVALGLRRQSRGMLLAAAGLTLGIVLSGSRGAWAGALAGLVAFWLVTFRWRPAPIIAGALGALALLGTVLLVPEGFIAGRFDLSDWSAQQRLLILFTAWDGIMRSPLLGWGPGSFEHMLPAIARQGLYDDVAMPHNIVLDIWFELGLFALICFIALCTACVVKAARVYRRTRDVRLAGLLAGIVAMIAASMFGSLFIRGVQETFILLIALTAALIHGHDSDTSTQPGNADPLPV